MEHCNAEKRTGLARYTAYEELAGHTGKSGVSTQSASARRASQDAVTRVCASPMSQFAELSTLPSTFAADKAMLDDGVDARTSPTDERSQYKERKKLTRRRRALSYRWIRFWHMGPEQEIFAERGNLTRLCLYRAHAAQSGYRASRTSQWGAP